MAMKLTGNSSIQVVKDSSSSSNLSSRHIHDQAGPERKKIVGVFYKANEYATINPNFVGCVEGSLGIRDWLEAQGHQYIVTDDKEGPISELEKHIPDLHILISVVAGSSSSCTSQ